MDSCIIFMVVFGVLGLGFGFLVGFWRGSRGLVSVSSELSDLRNRVFERERLDGEPFRLLELFQREARLVDLVMEDISGLSDEAVGVAVRPLFVKLRKVLESYVVLERVSECLELGVEGGDVAVRVFNPVEVRFVGNVGGGERGVLVHGGWVVRDHKVPKLSQVSSLGVVVAPAVVEVG